MLDFFVLIVFLEDDLEVVLEIFCIFISEIKKNWECMEEVLVKKNMEDIMVIVYKLLLLFIMLGVICCIFVLIWME